MVPGLPSPPKTLELTWSLAAKMGAGEKATEADSGDSYWFFNSVSVIIIRFVFTKILFFVGFPKLTGAL